MMNSIEVIIDTHRAGSPVGVYSVCSAHPLVLVTALRQAAADGSIVLIEATSNQVDQFGGYTGLTPEAFRDVVTALAEAEGFPHERIVLGGDHLGPNRWAQSEPDIAMSNADDLVAAYAAAGYQKLHIDCSMRLRGDPEPLSDALVAERAARLIAVAERHRPQDGVPPVYVIGTEVPVPGGAHETLGQLVPTSPAAAAQTLDAHRDALATAGISSVWPRIRALVVQPGVEFDHEKVIDYDRTQTARLQRVLDEHTGMVFEAHSTDYQPRVRLTELVEDHWAILKVGPGLTFALREALFALASIEDELVPDGRSSLPEVIDRRMLEEPGYWIGYYEGTPQEQRVSRRFSYSDRVRYYLTDPVVVDAQQRLFANLRGSGIPDPLISQYLPNLYGRVRSGEVARDPEALAVESVRDVLRDYSAACRSACSTAR
jgi:D-tagatose-1,6-bisphosphate aldolase subunit GatZ/KbaZ